MKTIEWCRQSGPYGPGCGRVRLIDQTKLPLKEEVLQFSDPLKLAEAIKTMKIRGAPAIGVAAAFALALTAVNSSAQSSPQLIKELARMGEVLAETRPTAVSLFWATRRMKKKAEASNHLSVDELKKVIEDEALAIAAETDEACRQIGAHGAQLINSGDSILTHCNAGGLATTGYGTALGVIKAAAEQGKKIHVFVGETRPLLQGARLTTWELTREKIPMTLITDDMAGFFMSRGKVDKVIVGADRITAEGDVANKIGTYSLAVLAKEHGLPFYVAAPLSTVDFSLESGDEIPIEERSSEEVTTCGGRRVAPQGIKVANPAFDITPHRLVMAIITEKGLAKPPLKESLAQFRG